MPIIKKVGKTTYTNLMTYRPEWVDSMTKYEFSLETHTDLTDSPITIIDQNSYRYELAINLNRSGWYLVDVYGAGGNGSGAVVCFDSWYRSAGGGSGAGFTGYIWLDKTVTKYTLIFMNTSGAGSSNTGYTMFHEYANATKNVRMEAGQQGAVNGAAGSRSSGNGGSYMSIGFPHRIIKKLAGKVGGFGISTGAIGGGKSVYDDTTTGYGAGGGAGSTWSEGKPGYFSITLPNGNGSYQNKKHIYTLAYNDRRLL